MSEGLVRCALVTGAGQGIGAATAQRLAADGVRVAVLDRALDGAESVAAAIRAGGGSAIALCADVTDRAEVDQAVAATVEAFGALNIVVNNAGVTRDNLFFKMTSEDWSTVMNVHLGGVFNVTQAAQRHLQAGGYGRVISLSSAAALGNRGQANYSAAKAGIEGFTRTIAAELGPYGVTANVIAPGFIATPMTDATAVRMGLSAEDLRASASKSLPARRVGAPEDIANAVAFFASEASSFVTGQVLYVDGGAGTVR